jgi:predicted Rossmann fold nucleotide-binding protein DprA/Smf involved in DNA uptake
MSAISETRKSIKELVSNLRNEQRRIGGQLEAAQKALKALDGNETTPKRTASRQRKTAPENGTQLKEVVPAGKLLRLLGKHDGTGIGTEALAAEANAERDQVLTLLKELETDGKVRRTGQRRGTRWFAATAA